MATIDDLVSTLHGGVHVSQEGYELRALQEYLSQHIALPPLASTSTSGAYRPMAPSRSASSTRYPTHTLGQSSKTFPDSQYFDAPHAHSHAHAHAHPRAVSRPAGPRRSSSYGCAVPPSPYAEYSAFEGDAFAPLVEQDTCDMGFTSDGDGNANGAGPSDPWARIRQANEKAAAGGAFGFGFGSVFGSSAPAQGAGFGFGLSGGGGGGAAWGGNRQGAFGAHQSAFGFGFGTGTGFGAHAPAPATHSAGYASSAHQSLSVAHINAHASAPCLTSVANANADADADDAMDAEMADERIDDGEIETDEDAVERGVSWGGAGGGGGAQHPQSHSQSQVGAGAEWARGRSW